MCCTTTHLGKGDAVLSHCSPLAMMQFRHLAFLPHQNVSPFYHSQVETSLSSCTNIDQRDFVPLWNPRSKGRSCLSPLTTPSTKVACHSPLDPLTERENSAFPLETHRPTVRRLDAIRSFHAPKHAIKRSLPRTSFKRHIDKDN